MSKGLSKTDLLAAPKVNNYILGATNFSQDTSTHLWTVPAGKRWYLIAGGIKRDAAQTCVVHIEDASAKLYYRLSAVAAGTSWVGFPNDETEGCPKGHEAVPIIIDAGEIIRVTFGGAQGAAASISCIVLEVPHSA